MSTSIITPDDVDTHVTLVIRKLPKGTLYVSGIVRYVSATHVTLGVMHHPSGPWDRFESYEHPTPIEHGRILRRS